MNPHSFGTQGKRTRGEHYEDSTREACHDNTRHLSQGQGRQAALETTSEQYIAQQQRIDNDEVLQDTAHFARRVRTRLGLTQLEFSERIDASPGPIRNREQCKRTSGRYRQGPAQGAG
jgi:DNA-binding transcriptional regulator YiaG